RGSAPPSLVMSSTGSLPSSVMFTSTVNCMASQSWTTVKVAWGCTQSKQETVQSSAGQPMLPQLTEISEWKTMVNAWSALLEIAMMPVMLVPPLLPSYSTGAETSRPS